MTVNRVCAGYTIPLIVMNGMSHTGLPEASQLPGETGPKGLLLQLLSCFYSIVKTMKKRPASLNMLKESGSKRATEDKRMNHRDASHAIQWKIFKDLYKDWSFYTPGIDFA